MVCSSAFAKDKTILKIIAHKKPSIKNPGTRSDVNQTIIALRIKVNKPRVTIVIGKVRINRIGFMIALKIPKTKDTTSAVKKFVT